MHPDLQRLMDQATALTRGGRLQEATQVIQRALGGGGTAAATAGGGGTAAATADGDVIDVEAREVPTPGGRDPVSLPLPAAPAGATSPSRSEAAGTQRATADARSP